jgi:CheY-like chemotaxis protein
MPSLDARLAPGQHFTALVVDDSTANRHILASLLESAGMTVLTAAGGLEAMEIARARHPHVIFMDLKMSDLDGLEATRRLARDPLTAAIPVIAVTASALGDVRQTARDAGCVDYLSKPIRAQLLFGLVQRHLGARFVSGPGELPGAPPSRPAQDVVDRGSIARRLREAIAIGDVAELQELAQQLTHGRPADAALGARINRLAMAFDFAALTELAGTLGE